MVGMQTRLLGLTGKALKHTQQPSSTRIRWSGALSNAETPQRPIQQAMAKQYPPAHLQVSDLPHADASNDEDDHQRVLRGLRRRLELQAKTAEAALEQPAEAVGHVPQARHRPLLADCICMGGRAGLL